jgi:uncharacterized protein involved in outer membrane biogenesis
MKKILVRVVLAALILLLMVFVVIGLFLDSAIKRGVETIGPRLTKVDVKLDSVSLSLLSGSGSLKGLVVGNPEGFKTKSAISVDSASLSLKPRSVFSDKVIIKSINLKSPEITLETNFKGNNLGRIRSNLQDSTGGNPAKPAAAKGSAPTPPNQPKPEAQEANTGKKLQVDEFVITGAKVHLGVTALGGEAATVSLADIRLKDLGQGPEGITAAELTDQVLGVIEQQAVQASGSLAGNVKDVVSNLSTNLDKSGSNAVSNLSKSIGNLFKKK